MKRLWELKVLRNRKGRGSEDGDDALHLVNESMEDVSRETMSSQSVQKILRYW